MQPSLLLALLVAAVWTFQPAIHVSGAVVERKVRQTEPDISCTVAGFFGHPTDCTRFYRCVDFFGTGETFSIFFFDCPAGTIFDEALSICNHPEWVQPPPICMGGGGQTTTPVADTTTESSTIPVTDFPVTSTTQAPTSGPVTSAEPTNPPTSQPSSPIPPVSTEEPTIPPVTNPVPTNPPFTSPVPTNPPVTTPVPTIPPFTSPQPTNPPVTTPAPTNVPISSPEPTNAPPTGQPVPTAAPVTSASSEAPVDTTPSAAPTNPPLPPLPTELPPFPTEAPTNPPRTDEPLPTFSTAPPPNPQPTEGPLTTFSTSAPTNPQPTEGPLTTLPTAAPTNPQPTEAPLTTSPTPAPTSAPATIVFPTEAPVVTTSAPFVLTCGSKKYYRHPLRCELYYQCLWNGIFNINILACPGGTFFDENQAKCLPPDQTTPCQPLSLPMAGVFTTGTLQTVQPSTSTTPSQEYTLAPGSLYDCKRPGHFPYELDCIRFYRCFEVQPGVLKGLLYKCPSGYGYDAKTTQRCQKQSALPPVCDRTDLIRSGAIPIPIIPLEDTTAVRVEDLETFFRNVNSFYQPRG